jgi:hypothetical protein
VVADEPRRSRRRSSDEEAPRSSRRRSRDDEEDEEPAAPRSRRKNKAKGTAGGASLGRGLDVYRSQRSSNFADSNKLKVTDKAVLVKFLEPDNFDTYRTHWVEGLPKGVKNSYTCYAKGDPMCDEGIPTRLLTLFNVINMDDGELYYIEAGPNLADAIADYCEDEEGDCDPEGPIDREDMYFSIKRKKKSNNFYEFTVKPVRERDLDDWQTEPLSDEEIDQAMGNLFTGEDVIQYTDIEAMEKIMDGLDD